MKRIAILGSTGSIGVNALKVIESRPRDFEVVALAAGRNIDLLASQIEKFSPRLVSVVDEQHAVMLRRRLGGGKATILWGESGYAATASIDGAEMVVSAMVGAAGLLPTLRAIEAGKDIALANKETLVMAGELVMRRAAEKKVRLIPVDSEHSAIFQCLNGERPDQVRKIILTASGGPFLRTPKEALRRVTVEDALKHPNWSMGRKITIDSASMMNKGLEVIEAKWLFGVEPDRIEIVVHPQSIIHSMVEFIDCSIIAQLGIPDMRIPIAYALSWPDRLPEKGLGLDIFQKGTLEFIPPDREKFPCLNLAYEAARIGGTMTAVLNAANEIAVEAFLAGRLGFTGIAEIIEAALGLHETNQIETVADVIAADKWARRTASGLIEKRNN
jgi:1-deoxy-D-xylulose-5-phosphate reductoisomerase